MRRTALSTFVLGAMLVPSLRGQVAQQGCPSDGQIGPVEAPTGQPRQVPISRADAARLAYYESSTNPTGLLAPLGWHCFGVYGSSGSALYISPDPIDTALPSQTLEDGFSGPALEIGYTNVGGFGSYEIAKVMARVFSAHSQFVNKIVEGFNAEFEFGPYATDILRYRSPTVVEYRTPAGKDGLGTENRLHKNSGPIDGVAILVGPTDAPDVVHLSVRLPSPLSALVPVIIGQVERDAKERRK